MLWTRYYPTMKRDERTEIRDLLDRISRIKAAEDWGDDLNPTQRAALAYLCKANRFSRAPSHVADYLSATRGTVSQTLKALARKSLITETRSSSDRRSISYDVTPHGEAASRNGTTIDAVLEAMNADEAAALAKTLKGLVGTILQTRAGRSFGICSTCRHHRIRADGTFCALLNEALAPREADQICHEHDAAA